jgi:hypothetical protein
VSGSVHIHSHARKASALSTKKVPARDVCGNELQKTRIDPSADMERIRVDTAQVGSLQLTRCREEVRINVRRLQVAFTRMIRGNRRFVHRMITASPMCEAAGTKPVSAHSLKKL